MTKHQQISQNWRHDTQHNDIQPNDTQHNDTQQKGLISDITTLIINNSTIMLNVIVLSVAIYLLVC